MSSTTVHSVSSALKNKVRIITFSNSKKKNALSGNSYGEIARILNQDAADPQVVATVFTGLGNDFTSGNDLTAILEGKEDFETASKKFFKNFNNMILALINYPKLLVTVVNGTAIGIGLTLAGLCDVNYATSNAYFSAPFVKLGLCIEGSGSFLLPRILGKSKATEVLILGHKLTAEEAFEYKLVSKVIPQQEVGRFLEDLVLELGKLDLEPVLSNKKLMSDNLRKQLLECAEREAKTLWECQNSDYFMNKMLEFINRKSKL